MHNNVLVYPNNLKVEDLILQNSKTKPELENMNHSMGDDTASAIKVTKILHGTILAHPEQMSWPPKEYDLLPDKVKMYIPNLLDVFCSTFLSGKSSASESTTFTRLKNSIAQDIVYVSGGKVKTPKSALFPAVVKSLCNNVEVIKLISNYGHGVSYNLIEEIETEHALMVINEQKEKVIIPKEAFQDDGSCCVGLMVADNIDNLECTLSG